MLRQLYLSFLGYPISLALNVLSRLHKPFMVYGYFDRPSGRWRRNTRVSSSAVLGARERLSLADNVWIGHQSVIDASNGVSIGEGTQLSPGVGLFSHGSETALRLHGRDYIQIPAEERLGYTRGPINIGRYCYVGARSILLPGVTLGDGCLVSAGSIVTRSAPPFSLLRGTPARIVGDVRALDAPFWSDAAIRNSYFDPEAMCAYLDANGVPPLG